MLEPKRTGGSAQPKAAADAEMSLMGKAYSILRQQIITCALPPGADISEGDLAERLQMSKTPIREALLRLRNDGFVETFPRRGYRILPASLADMTELIDTRNILEGGAAALAAPIITDQELDHLDRLADASYRPGEEATVSFFVDANRRFHSAIAAAAQRARLSKLIGANLSELERFFYIGARVRDIATETNSDHHRIVEVLRMRDPKRARDIMIAHNEATREGLLRALAINNSMRHINLF